MQEQANAWCQQLQQQANRFRLRSHPRAAAAAAAASRRGWGIRDRHPAGLSPGSPAMIRGWMSSDGHGLSSISNNSNVVALRINDLVPAVEGGDDRSTWQEARAIMAAAAAGTVTRCCAERDHQGRISALLPRSCLGGAFCGSSSSSSSGGRQGTTASAATMAKT